LLVAWTTPDRKRVFWNAFRTRRAESWTVACFQLSIRNCRAKGTCDTESATRWVWWPRMLWLPTGASTSGEAEKKKRLPGWTFLDDPQHSTCKAAQELRKVTQKSFQNLGTAKPHSRHSKPCNCNKRYCLATCNRLGSGTTPLSLYDMSSAVFYKGQWNGTALLQTVATQRVLFLELITLHAAHCTHMAGYGDGSPALFN
jgi:hypothetical protein